MSRSDDVVLSSHHKSIPPRMWGRKAQDVAAETPPVSDFATPLLTLDRGASDRNVERMIQWTRRSGVLIAPHGKTTMAPELWRRFVEAGAWGITVATPWQAEVAIEAGIRRILIANEVADAVGIASVAAATDRGVELYCWVDSLAGVRLLADGAGANPIRVLVEHGRPGGRTGARGVDATLEVAAAVRSERSLLLCGVSGFEWTYGPERSPESDERISAFVDELGELARRLEAEHAFAEPPIISAGGSIWFDVVARQLAGWTDRARVIVRSGCVQTSDHGFFAAHSPFAGTEFELEPALTVRASVLSVPEPGLAILNAGKRDLSEDLGGPRVLDVTGAVIERLNDQHGFMRFPADIRVDVGRVVTLGISHPCTTFDRWRLIPEIASAADPRVVGFVETRF